MSNRGSSCATAQRWSLDARTVPARRLRCAARAQLDAARAGRQSALRGGRYAAAPLRVPAVCAARRRDGELRRARRRRRTALRFVRRVPAAGRRPAALALRPAGGPRAEAAGCRSRSCDVSRPRTTRCSARGDMLYLPPHFAHDGIAIDACMTYSIGFRAPRANELATAFLDCSATGSHSTGAMPIRISRASREPARIGATMQRRCAAMLARDSLGPRDVEPLSRHVPLRAEARRVLFDRPCAAAVARQRSRRSTARTASASTCARSFSTTTRHLFINGTRCPWPSARRADRCGTLPTNARCPRALARARRRHSALSVRLVSRWLSPHRLRLTPRPSRSRARRRSSRSSAQVAALDEIIGLAQHSIRIFDFDMSEMGWNSRRAPSGCRRSCARSRTSKVEIIVHDTRWLEASCPRLIAC